MSKDIRVGHTLREGDTTSARCFKCGAIGEKLGQPCVSLIWATPDGDTQIAYMARVSNPKAKPEDESYKLIEFLLRNHHWSPFEMANMAIEVNTTRDITAQILRHKSAAFQEFSTRYADVEELETYKECRFQDTKNRQNSFEATGEDKETVEWWNHVVEDTAALTGGAYKLAREKGIAKEVARSILPIGLMPSKLYINGTIRTWIHYCMERTKLGVQKEHREIAQAAEVLLEQHYPNTYIAMQRVRFADQRVQERAEHMRQIEEYVWSHDPNATPFRLVMDVLADMSHYGLKSLMEERNAKGGILQ